jgi:hypothetical protein
MRDARRISFSQATNEGSEATNEAGFPDESIRQELGRILASRTFKGAEAQKRFLQHVVEQTITGNSNEVKEYTVGVQVFRRGS